MSKEINQLPATSLGLSTDLYEKEDGVTGVSQKITGAQITLMTKAGVKAYRALITQSTNSAPTAIVLENSLSGAIVWTRSAAGVYFGTLVGAFPVSKTFSVASQGTGTASVANIARFDDDVIQITTKEWDGFSFTETDNLLNDTSVEILIYP